MRIFIIFPILLVNGENIRELEEGTRTAIIEGRYNGTAFSEASPELGNFLSSKSAQLSITASEDSNQFKLQVDYTVHDATPNPNWHGGKTYDQFAKRSPAEYEADLQFILLELSSYLEITSAELESALVSTKLEINLPGMSYEAVDETRLNLDNLNLPASNPFASLASFDISTHENAVSSTIETSVQLFLPAFTETGSSSEDEKLLQYVAQNKLYDIFSESSLMEHGNIKLQIKSIRKVERRKRDSSTETIYEIDVTVIYESIEFTEETITQTVLDALENMEHEFDVKTTETAKMDPCLLVTCKNADWSCLEGVCSRTNFNVECNGDGAKLQMRFGHLFDRIDALQMPFDFSTSVLFNDAVIEAQPSESENYDVELYIPISAFEIDHANSVISYGGRVKGAEGLITDIFGLGLILGGPISTGFRCVFPDSLTLSTSTNFTGKSDEDAESPWTLGTVDNVGDGGDDTVAAVPAAFEVENSVDPDNPPKIGDRITISVRPTTGFAENNPIVYFISKITVSDPVDDTTSLEIYNNPCALSFLDMEFSNGTASTNLSQLQTFSLDSFVFPGSSGMQFDIEMKMCVVAENGETVDPECTFDDICTAPYSIIAT